MSAEPRVLMLVEDHSETRRAFGAIFSRKGWDVCLATTVAEALALLERGLEPDCLILDSRLPDGRGEAVLSKVLDAKLKTNVVICTGDPDAMRLVGSDTLRPDMILFKPVDPAVVCNLCNGNTHPGSWAFFEPTRWNTTPDPTSR